VGDGEADAAAAAGYEDVFWCGRGHGRRFWFWREGIGLDSTRFLVVMEAGAGASRSVPGGELRS
jgi:hypothetical protein